MPVKRNWRPKMPEILLQTKCVACRKMRTITFTQYARAVDKYAKGKKKTRDWMFCPKCAAKPRGKPSIWMYYRTMTERNRINRQLKAMEGD